MVPTELDVAEVYEAARLAALYRYGVLDTAAEPVWDNLCRLAAQICEAPIALIGFIDQSRHWFKAAYGWKIEALPREQSWCAQAICRPEPLLLTDLDQDPRYREHPLVVRDPWIRAYASQPLIDGEGFVLGTLSVMDPRPRQFSLSQLQGLQTVAEQVMAQLQLRRFWHLEDPTVYPSTPEEVPAAPLVNTDPEVDQGRKVWDPTHPQVHPDAQRAHEQLYRRIVDTAQEGIWVVDKQGKTCFINRRLGQLLGYTAPEMLGRGLVEFVEPDQRQMVQRLVVPPGQNKVFPEQLEICWRRKDGSPLWSLVSTSPMLESEQEGGFLGTLYMVIDISLRKQAEAQLRQVNEELERRVEARTAEWIQANRALAQSEERFRSIFTEAPIGIALTHRQGHILTANRALAEMLGYADASELVGLHLGSLAQASLDLTPEEWQQEKQQQERLAQGEIHSYRQVRRFLRRDGRWVWTQLTFGRISTSDSGQHSEQKSEQKEEGYGLTMVEDITERQALEGMKDEFISIVSHELRTPLTSIHGALSLMATGKLGSLLPKGERLLQIAATNTERLVRLVNDILDLDRMEAGSLSMEKKPCDAAELIRYAAETMRSMAEQAQVHLVTQPLPVTIHADPDRIIQTLTNLLSNAIKFSPRGATVRLGAKQRHAHQVIFWVQDQGRGIPAANLETIFHRFKQVDSSDSREKGGTGLGLAICRSIVRQHGGRIWVESEVGKGSTFFFTLPLFAPE
ncbi:PAS domain S-box protein [Thermostichus vulcanus]|uniref:histidine kinase n=1 Tax=Thermostichus vulcanus str. 'Rupite' TaxID=2813851 RepID=A0ABT0C8K3_THEVL|nr:PAS domain S-box protein [Thermostichus vulcanus]MCJ2542124.1 PAS domain S-box protein [Thermostichus vulcanus str. 'Rupite']